MFFKTIAYCLPWPLIGYHTHERVLLGETGIEFHWLRSGTKLEKRSAKSDPGNNRLDKNTKQHDIDYARAKNLQVESQHEDD